MAVKTDKPPTSEELDTGMKQALDKVEKMDSVAATPDQAPDPAPEPTETPETDETPKDDSQPAPVPEVTPQPESKPEPETDTKKKLAASARENQVLLSRTKKMDEAVDAAAGIPEPTDDEMAREFPDWAVMDETSKRLAKDSVVNKRRFELIHDAAKAGKDIAEWNSKVDQYLDDPKTLNDHPELEGRTEDFKYFATKPTRRGLDFDDLVKAFLYDVSQSTKPTKKGAMFETGTGGPNDKPARRTNKLTVEQGRQLMKTDYNKFVELLKAGQIEYE